MELVEKKLRDITKEEFKDWVGRNCGKIICKACPFEPVNCGANDENNWVRNKDIFADSFLNRRMLVEQKDILDKEEKEYLRAVIKPFRNECNMIRKIKSAWYTNKEWISINVGDKYPRDISLPYFEANSMYTGMVNDRAYTLKELGL